MLDQEDAKKFLTTSALLYLAPDRPEVKFAVKECMRKASAPQQADLGRL